MITIKDLKSKASSMESDGVYIMPFNPKYEKDELEERMLKIVEEQPSSDQTKNGFSGTTGKQVAEATGLRIQLGVCPPLKPHHALDCGFASLVNSSTERTGCDDKPAIIQLSGIHYIFVPRSRCSLRLKTKQVFLLQTVLLLYPVPILRSNLIKTWNLEQLYHYHTLNFIFKYYIFCFLYI